LPLAVIREPDEKAHSLWSTQFATMDLDQRVPDRDEQVPDEVSAAIEVDLTTMVASPAQKSSAPPSYQG
jgi:hypothetical protein